jgi:hypothetical protein
MNFELKMPDLSTTGSPIKVVRWLVAVGESVERGAGAGGRHGARITTCAKHGTIPCRRARIESSRGI